MILRVDILFAFRRFLRSEVGQLKQVIHGLATPDEMAVWRVEPTNKFSETPQAWVTSLTDKSETRTGIISLHPDVFRAAPRIDLLHRNIVWQENYRNLEITKQLSKAEMPGGGHKPWPQKKMGRHHAGSIRSPHFRTGGFAHGVRGPRTWFYMLPDAIRIGGLCAGLTLKHIQNDVVVVDDYQSLPSDDPQYLHDLAESRNWGYSVLFINESSEVSVKLTSSCAKISSFNVMPVYGFNCFSLIKYDTIVFSEKALMLLQMRILFHMHRAESLQRKYFYKDIKRKIMAEAEKEADTTQIPFV